MKVFASAILIVLISFGAGFFSGKYGDPQIERTVSDTTNVQVIHYDTIQHHKDSITYFDVPRFINVTWDTRVNEVGDSVLVEIKHYSDTLKVDSAFSIYYFADVWGVLEGIKLGYTDDRPIIEKVINNTTTITNDNFISPSGLYLGGGINTDGDFSSSVIVLKNRMAYQGSYNFNKKIVSAGAHFRIWNFKSL